MARYVMVIDTKRCTGCHTCAMACKLENNLADGVWWNQVFSGTTDNFTGDRTQFTQGKLARNANLKIDVASGSFINSGGLVNNPSGKNIRMDFYTKSCQHCNSPKCVEKCPTGASYKDEETGVVNIDSSKCIGCDTCISVCPYDVRHHNTSNEAYFSTTIGGQGISKHKANTVDKCSFCSHRLAQGEPPACVYQCPAKARIFGNISDPTSEVSKMIKSRTVKTLLPDNDTEPSVYFLY